MAELDLNPVFQEAYDRLGDRAAARVDRMLDRLEEEHDEPAMRNGLRIGEVSLWATPRIPTDEGDYRVTWQYVDPADHSVIECVTLAIV